MLANALNRSELTSIRAENDRLKKESTEIKNGQAPTVTDEEIDNVVARADADPGNFTLQRDSGIGLYRYGRMTENPDIIAKSSRLLARANQLNPKDYDITLGLGHAYFDTGYYGKQNSSFVKAREFYQKALAMKPGDVEVQTEIGMTYFLLDPPENEKAILEFQKSLQIDPSHEKTIQFLAQAYAKIKKLPEAEKLVAKLKEINPQNPEITVIDSLISQARAGQAK